MLGITPRLLRRPLLGHRRTTRAFWTVAKPSTHTLLRREALRTVEGGRYKSTAAGNDKSGHIQAGKNEGIFFTDSRSRAIQSVGYFRYLRPVIVVDVCGLDTILHESAEAQLRVRAKDLQIYSPSSSTS